MATAHLIHGYLGAGKTTLARELEANTGGIRFSADEWYMRLYVGEGSTPHLDENCWSRVLQLIDELWPAILKCGIEVIVDFGLWRRADRDRARVVVASIGATALLYEVVCDEAVAIQRCVARSHAAAGSFRIDALIFEELKAKFEALEPDEERIVVDTTP